MFQAQVKVYLRPSIQDPQGVVIERTLKQLGFNSLDSVRTGRYFRLLLNSTDKVSAAEEADKMCRELLANTVIEDFSVTVEEVK